MIRPKDGPPCYLVPNALQMKLIPELSREQARLVIVKARQLGSSTIGAAHLLWRVLRSRNKNGLILGDDKDTAATLLGIIHFAYRNLPPWFVQTQGIQTEYETKSEITFLHNGSTLSITSAGARQPGRGRTLHYVLLSEAAFYEDASRLTRALFAAVPKTGDTCIIVESTGNGPSGFFHERYQSADKGKSEYKAIFLPWHEHEEYRRPGERVSDKDEYEEFLLRIGATEEHLAWRRHSIANDYDGDVSAFTAEYPATVTEAFVATTATIFDPTMVQTRAEEADGLPRHKGFIVHDQSGGYRWHEVDPRVPGRVTVWKFPESGRAYILGADVGSGIGGPNSEEHSYSSADVLDAATGEQVAHMNEATEPAVFAQGLELLGHFYNDALIAPEVTGGHGLAVNNALRDLAYPHLYRRKQFDTATQQWTELLGWNTTKRSKELIVSELRADFRTGGCVVNSVDTLGEMLSFIRKEDGSLGGVGDARDDRCMSLAIANHVRRESGAAMEAIVRSETMRPKTPEDQRRADQARAEAEMQNRLLPYKFEPIEDIEPNKRIVPRPDAGPRYDRVGY